MIRITIIVIILVIVVIRIVTIIIAIITVVVTIMTMDYYCFSPDSGSAVSWSGGGVLLSCSSYGLESKLLKGGYIGDYIGDYFRAY